MKRIMPWACFFLVFTACSRGPTIDRFEIRAAHAPGALPREDPESPLWSDAVEHPGRLMVQDIAEPRLIEPGVELVSIRALHDGDWIVFRLEWDDATEDRIPESGKSCDAAAVQFPVNAGADVPDPAMGAKGAGVRIWYWKSLWQDDDERRATGKGDRIASLYPNTAPDHYPFDAADRAKREEMRRIYSPALAAGNPNLARDPHASVQVLSAEGFGDTKPAADQLAAGRGLWKSGRWRVTIARPLRGGNDLPPLSFGEKSYVAFAVWDGAAGHAGSRKMRSGWISLLLEAP